MKTANNTLSISKAYSYIRTRFMGNVSKERIVNFFTGTPGQYLLLLSAVAMEGHSSAGLLLGMIAAIPMPPKPAALPMNTSISGRYYCNANITDNGSSNTTEVTLMYNTCTGNIIGLPTNAARHSFGYNMSRRNIERSKTGIFYWGADIRNKNYYRSLSHSLFLLKDGNLASAKVSKLQGSTSYEVRPEDMHTIVVFSKTGIFGNKQDVAKEIAEIAENIDYTEYLVTGGYTA